MSMAMATTVCGEANGDGKRDTLPQPRITGCACERAFPSYLATLKLEWDDHDVASRQLTWSMPRDFLLSSPVPVRFGIRLVRLDLNSYSLYVIWNETRLAWDHLTRQQVARSSLPQLLAALGTDLEELLDQPIEASEGNETV